MSNLPELVSQLRYRFLTERTSFVDFDRRDVDRVKSDDAYLRRFILHRKRNVADACELLVTCLKWRKTFYVNDLSEATVDRHYFEIGLGFVHNTDKKGNPLLILNIQKHKKNSQTLPELKKYVVYSLEKQAKAMPEGQVTVLFDMTDTGLTNMDLDFMKFFINCFKFYFPNMLELLLVYNLPWILQAAWKIIRSWLSENARQLVKFVNKDTILDYVDSNQLLVQFGGTDTWEYQYLPEVSTETPAKKVRFNMTGQGDEEVSAAAAESTSVCQDESDRRELTELQESEIADAMMDSKENDGNVQQQKQVQKQALVRRRSVESKPGGLLKRSSSSDMSASRSWLKLKPSDVIEFVGSHKENSQTVLHLTNATDSTLSFKVKTTSPEHFSVKSSVGIVVPGETIKVNITLHQGHYTLRDKFLILCTKLVDGSFPSVDQLAVLWKTISSKHIQEQRLPCRLVESLNFSGPSGNTKGSSSGVSFDSADTYDNSFGQKLSELNRNVLALKDQVTRLSDENGRLLNRLEHALSLQLNLFLVTLLCISIALAIVLRLGQFDPWL